MHLPGHSPATPPSWPFPSHQPEAHQSGYAFIAREMGPDATLVARRATPAEALGDSERTVSRFVKPLEEHGGHRHLEDGNSKRSCTEPGVGRGALRPNHPHPLSTARSFAADRAGRVARKPTARHEKRGGQRLPFDPGVCEGHKTRLESRHRTRGTGSPPSGSLRPAPCSSAVQGGGAGSAGGSVPPAPPPTAASAPGRP